MAIGSNPLLMSAGVTGYEIERSLRFNKNDSAYLNRTPSSAGNRKTWTWSGWVKRGKLGTGKYALFGGSGTNSMIRFNNDDGGDGLRVLDAATGGYDLITDRKFRDTSAWYHFVVAVDTTQSTASNRVKIYVNGVQETSFYSSSYPTQNAELTFNNNISHTIGYAPGSTYHDGYLAEVHFIDGQALDPTDFGEFDDNGVWQPIAYAGSYGTNGYHLDFSDNSTNAALGTDSSGNGNDWTVNNINASDAQINNENYYKNGSGTSESAYSGGTLPFDGTASTYVNASGAITNTAWNGARLLSSTVIRWQPPNPISINSSIDFYGGSVINTATNYTLKIVYTDATQVTTTGTTSNGNWVKRLNDTPTGKSLSYVEADATSYLGFIMGIRIDGQFVLNSDSADCDSLFDSPANGTQNDTGAGGEVSGNYCTMNALIMNQSAAITSNGNLHVYYDPAVNNWTGNIQGTNYATFVGTMGLTSGKWYFEAVETFRELSSQSFVIGVVDTPMGGQYYIGTEGNGIGYTRTQVINGLGSPSVVTPGMPDFSPGDIIGVALDLDNGKIYFSKNGTYINSGDPVAGTGFLASGLSGTFYPAVSKYSVSHSIEADFNFGQRPFVSAAPSGFKALCTANLPDPTIADGSTAMDVSIWDGTSSTQSITGLGFSPDLVWGKRRSGTADHVLIDVIRGTSVYLRSNSTSANTSNSNVITSLNSDGFTLGTNGVINDSGSTNVGWTWDAGTSTGTNTDGTITSSVRANPSAGFSIVTWTGTGAAGTIGHGLGAKPDLLFLKVYSGDVGGWFTYSSDLGALKLLQLNSTSRQLDNGNYWNSTEPTSSVFSVGSAADGNGLGKSFLAYCFTSVEDYSSIGLYTGNGSTNGPFIYTGFRPAFVLYKRVESDGNWHIDDYKRAGYNFKNYNLYPNLSSPESTGSFIDLLSNGFKLRTSSASRNTSGGTYLYAAFSENPFKTARAR